MLLKSAADCHDMMSKVTCEKLLDIHLEIEKGIQGTLPIKHSGLDFTSVKAISSFALMHTLNELPNCFPDSSLLISVILGMSLVGQGQVNRGFDA